MPNDLGCLYVTDVYIGKRLLLRRGRGAALHEVTLLEVSPNGRLRFRWQSGAESWEERNTYEAVEVLPCDPLGQLCICAQGKQSSFGHPWVCPTHGRVDPCICDRERRVVGADWFSTWICPNHGRQGRP